MKIQEVNIGWPIKIATDLLVRVLPFNTEALMCNLYYEILSTTGERLSEGNLSITEEEFANWGQDNSYIDDITLIKLGLERAIEDVPIV